MNLFNDPIHEIKFKGIKKFCEAGTPEGVKVDYKSEFPSNKKLAKVISSFANTWGGIIIVGVKEENRIPQLPIEGIDYPGNYEEKVTSICISQINPPISPEVYEIPLDNDKDKCVVLIRIVESDETPHRVEHDTEIYIRENSISYPYEQKAPWDAIEWLLNKREKAINNREKLIERAFSRIAASSYLLTSSPYRQLIVSPLYPNSILFQYKDFERIIKEVEKSSYRISYSNTSGEKISQSQSILFVNKRNHQNNTVHDFIEINQYGFFIHRGNFSEKITYGKNDEIDLHYTTQHLADYLEYSLKFLTAINYFGLVFISLRYSQIKNKQISDYARGSFATSNQYYGSSQFDDSYSYEKVTSLESIKNNFDDIIFEFISDFLWSLGASKYSLDKEYISSRVKTILSK